MALNISNVDNNNNKITELFDWIVNNKHVRGSRRNDCGLWLHNSAMPKYFNPDNRIVELEDGSCYLLKKNTVCKALGLDKISEAKLAVLPVKSQMKEV